MASFLPRTIGGLAALTAVASGLITAALGAATFYVVHEEIERQIDHRITMETNALLAYHRQYGLAALAEVVKQRNQAIPGETGRTLGHIVVDGRGERLVDTLRSPLPPLGWSEFLHFRRPDGTAGVAQTINSQLPGGGYLVVAVDREIVNQMDRDLLKLFAAAFALVVLASSGATIGFGRIVRRRMRAIEESAEAIMDGELTRRMTLDGSGGEFDRLAIVLNRMLDRIGVLLENLRQVSSDVAHDLRTPLNRLRNRLEALEQVAGEEAKGPLDEAIGEADDLLELFWGLLTIAEIEGQSMRSRFVSVDLAATVSEVIEAYRPAFENAGLTLEGHLESAQVFGDRRLLQQCVASLLDNILVHTPRGTHAEVRLERLGTTIALGVSDNGPGIPATDSERIFDRFTRLEASRSTPGHGIGLSLVAAIVRAHFGAVRATVLSPGLSIDLRLPGDAGAVRCLSLS